ncbi:hypothetical protein LT85_0349 [Collimonas arenae]|uniref:Uncharacterized protein n=1 Tax=Collimonas arenae TaxID=279058 RepID=A0A0A1F741_9BURK|nr:hypothetical protein LT85_0349 [Collimonas arenae]
MNVDESAGYFEQPARKSQQDGFPWHTVLASPPRNCSWEGQVCAEEPDLKR